MLDYRRWRHSKGFGVHSPFAYEIVKRVLYPGRRYGWYGYEQIEEKLESGDYIPHIRRRARLLLRLAAFLDIRSAFLPADSHPALRSALLAANSETEVVCDPKKASQCRLIVTTGQHLPEEKLCRHLGVDNTIVLIYNLPEGWKERMFYVLPHGLMMHDSKSALLINRPGMNKIAYTIKL